MPAPIPTPSSRSSCRGTSQASRAAVYRTLQNTLVSQLPVMIVMRTPILSVAGTKVSGYALNPLGWGLYTDVKVG
jgi:hypothetical protein